MQRSTATTFENISKEDAGPSRAPAGCSAVCLAEEDEEDEEDDDYQDSGICPRPCALLNYLPSVW